jgi:hypothetical protein
MNDEEKKREDDAEINDESDVEKSPKEMPKTDEKYEDVSVFKKMQGLTSNQMFAACVIAFSLGTLLMLVVAWVLQLTGTVFTIPVILSINIIPTMVGGLVSAFLFTRRSRVNYLIDGAKIGLGGFIISYLYTSLLGLGGGGAYILIGFLSGGVLGGLVAKKYYN